MVDARFLSSDAVADLATPADYVDAVREGYRERGTGAPARPRSVLTGDDGLLTEYTAILPEIGGMGGYQYTAGFASADAWFVSPLFDADTGEPLAVIDGAAMNPWKTGAAGGVAVDELARADATRVGVIGTGRQARGQLRATAVVRDLDDVRVFSPTPDHRAGFAAAMDDELDAAVSAMDTPAAAVRDADVVITATTASGPVFDGEDLAPGTHVTAMGQYHPEKHEIDARTVERSTYVLDLRERADRDAGALMKAREAGIIGDDHVHAELGEIVAGDRPGRTAADEITVFDSGGTGIETVAAAAMLYERAVRADRGTPIEFSGLSDVHPRPS